MINLLTAVVMIIQPPIFTLPSERQVTVIPYQPSAIYIPPIRGFVHDGTTYRYTLPLHNVRPREEDNKDN